MNQPIRWFAEVGLADVALVGGKGANLGELATAKFPVPPGFIITSEACLDAMEQSGARDKLRALMSSVEAEDPQDLATTCAAARDLIEQTPIPIELAREVLAAYHELGGDIRVAVRSSGTSEDTGGTSFAGMNASFTNVAGDASLLARVVDCWASIYGERVISYRAAAIMTEEPSLAVIVQQMIASDASGVIFTADPTTRATDRLVIESVCGQGEAIVSGRVEHDTYVVAKDGPKVLSVRIGHKLLKIVRDEAGADCEVALTDAEADRRVLDGDEIHHLAEVGSREALRMSAGHRICSLRQRVLSRPVPPDYHSPGAFGRSHRLRTTGADPWIGRLGRTSVWSRQDSHVAGQGKPATLPRSPRGADDKPGLGPRDASRGSSDHRRRRHDLPRRHRVSRTWRAVRRGCPHCHEHVA